MKNVLIVCKSMSIGGVEKSLVSLLHTLSPQEYEVDLLLLERSGGFLSQVGSCNGAGGLCRTQGSRKSSSNNGHSQGSALWGCSKSSSVERGLCSDKAET